VGDDLQFLQAQIHLGRSAICIRFLEMKNTKVNNGNHYRAKCPISYFSRDHGKQSDL